MVVFSEIRKHGMPAAREERYAVLDRLDVVRTDLPPRTTNETCPFRPGDRELVQAIGRRSSTDVLRPSSLKERCMPDKIFPWSTETGWSTGELRAREDATFDLALSSAHVVVSEQATKLSRARETSHRRLRFADLPSEPVDAEAVTKALDETDRIISDPTELEVLYPLLSAPMRLHRAAAERQIVRDSGTMGLSRAEAKGAGARGESDKKQLDRYLFAANLKHRAEEVCCMLGMESVEEVQSAVHQLTVEDCPGWWLWQHVQLVFRAAEPSPKPSNFFDLEHLFYLSYVDVFFADKRTCAYTDTALRKPERPQALTGITLPICVSGNTIADVELALGMSRPSS